MTKYFEVAILKCSLPRYEEGGNEIRAVHASSPHFTFLLLGMYHVALQPDLTPQCT